LGPGLIKPRLALGLERVVLLDGIDEIVGLYVSSSSS
jgi:hypothetical protein